MISTPVNAALLLLQASGRSALPAFLFQITAFVAIFYFIIIRPQQKQKRQHEETIRGVKRGDRIVTAGGIIGEVVHVKEQVVDGQPKRAMDDEVTIRSGESRLIIERGRIAKVIVDPAATTSA
jgi:preprotein translocase subunit YajC